MVKSCRIFDVGIIGYAEAYAMQKRLVAARIAESIGDVLLICEHTPVITLGRNGKREHLLVGENVLRQRNIEFFESSRGGDVTYHGPGQIVGYPILQLGAIRKDVVGYVRMLEEVMIRTTAEFEIVAEREFGKTGIWVSAVDRQSASHAPEKLGAIGVHISRWVTSHGFAYNVSTDLRNFDLIVPCGIAGRKATSLEKILERSVNNNEVLPRMTRHFGDVFGFEMTAGSKQALQDELEFAEQQVVVPA